ncbi:MAG: hypothetical protein A2882_13865 [Phenylobacterium sp. RIFCSPHIGHO2_01_FULL_70_10]|nr:MAG: hypothetical protein A2882_13865 [Phenylobacterium sp. RIFCSPHIGHO2_01_FULL_70_10]
MRLSRSTERKLASSTTPRAPSAKARPKEREPFPDSPVSESGTSSSYWPAARPAENHGRASSALRVTRLTVPAMASPSRSGVIAFRTSTCRTKVEGTASRLAPRRLGSQVREAEDTSTPSMVRLTNSWLRPRTPT